jgi:hypothetical protein
VAAVDRVAASLALRANAVDELARRRYSARPLECVQVGSLPVAFLVFILLSELVPCARKERGVSTICEARPETLAQPRVAALLVGVSVGSRKVRPP